MLVKLLVNVIVCVFVPLPGPPSIIIPFIFISINAGVPDTTLAVTFDIADAPAPPTINVVTRAVPLTSNIYEGKVSLPMNTPFDAKTAILVGEAAGPARIRTSIPLMKVWPSLLKYSRLRPTVSFVVYQLFTVKAFPKLRKVAVAALPATLPVNAPVKVFA